MTVDQMIVALNEIKRDGARGDAIVFFKIDNTLARAVGKVDLKDAFTVYLERK